MAANDSTLDLAKLRAMLGKIPPAPQIYWTHLLTGNKAYTRDDRTYISPAAMHEFRKLPARPSMQGELPAFGAVSILNAEDVARSALGIAPRGIWPEERKIEEPALTVCRDLLAIANAEYGDRAGAALQMAFNPAPTTEEG